MTVASVRERPAPISAETPLLGHERRGRVVLPKAVSNETLKPDAVGNAELLVGTQPISTHGRGAHAKLGSKLHSGLPAKYRKERLSLARRQTSAIKKGAKVIQSNPVDSPRRRAIRHHASNRQTH